MLPTGSSRSYPDVHRRLVDQYLEGLDFGPDKRTVRLVEAMRYSLLAGGKRIRPVLTVAVAENLGRPPQTVLPTAAALELIHTYSLIHDDLPAIDNDTLRRGQPTCHVVYGEDVAILAGDGLFAEAFRLILQRQRGSAEAIVATLREIADATGVGGMVGGQYMDISGAARTDADLRALHAMKTGRLIEAAVVCGAILCGCSIASELKPFRVFSREIGLLFQIVDDILDVEGDSVLLGKSAGKDLAQEKVTYVSQHGLAGARELAAASHARALQLLGGLGGETASLAAIVDHIYLRRQ